MSNAQIARDAAGVLHLSGVLDYSTGPLLRQQGQALIGDGADQVLQINCAAVERSSSVGLALLLAYMRDAQRVGKTVELLQLPEDMRKIAKVCGLTEMLGIEPIALSGSATE